MLAILSIVLIGIFFFLRVFIALSADLKHCQKSAVTNLTSETFGPLAPPTRSTRVLAFRARLTNGGGSKASAQTR